MKYLSVVLLGLTLSVAAHAEDDNDDTGRSRTITVQQGARQFEEEEVEVYDYHTGTIQTFKVYRKLKKAGEPINPAKSENASDSATKK